MEKEKTVWLHNFFLLFCEKDLGKKYVILMYTMALTNSSQISPNKCKYVCDVCSIATNNKKDYTNHMLTAKHKKSMYANVLLTEVSPISPVSQIHTCDKCNKSYKSRVGLWKHKKKCSQQPVATATAEPELTNSFIPNSTMPLDTAMIIELLKQNQEFKDLLLEQNKQMMELAGKIGNTTNNNNIKNQQNNNFNLQVFLNETCKDAVCINDFIKDLPVSFKQLENIGQNGYVAGITEVIISYLKTMEVTERPLHCTDTKRDTMYVKEMDKWVKDDDNNTKMTRIFRTIANKNLRTIRKWAEEHPNSQESNTKENEFCTSVMLNSLGAIGDEQIKYDNKVLKTIAKFVHIDRNITE
jgi:hypothetical protein